MTKLLILVIAIMATANAQQRRAAQPFQNQRQQQQQYNQYQNQEYNEQQNIEQKPKPQYQAKPEEYKPNLKESTTYVPIIRFDKEQGVDGSYKAAWETGNNILAQEEGFLKSLGPDPDKEGQTLNAQVQQGSYTYLSPEGQQITITYIADEKGFHPQGDHLPTPPPVSPEVQKGLDLIYEGIRAQQEAAEREQRENPNYKPQPVEDGRYRP